MYLVINSKVLNIFILLVPAVVIFAMGMWTSRNKSLEPFSKVIIQLKTIKLNIYRFMLHLITMIPIVIVLYLIYLLLQWRFNYGASILPELIGTIISVIVIDFLIKEREIKEKHSLSELIENKIDRIGETINEILLKFIDFDDYDNERIDKELLVNILEKQKLDEQSIEYDYLDATGNFKSEKISKFDYVYFVGKDLLPVVENLIAKYGRYIDNEILCDLIKLEDILNQRLFKFRISSMGLVDSEHYQAFAKVIIDYLAILQDLSNKLKSNEGGK